MKLGRLVAPILILILAFLGWFSFIEFTELFSRIDKVLLFLNPYGLLFIILFLVLYFIHLRKEIKKLENVRKITLSRIYLPVLIPVVLFSIFAPLIFYFTSFFWKGIALTAYKRNLIILSGTLIFLLFGFINVPVWARIVESQVLNRESGGGVTFRIDLVFSSGFFLGFILLLIVIFSIRTANSILERTLKDNLEVWGEVVLNDLKSYVEKLGILDGKGDIGEISRKLLPLSEKWKKKVPLGENGYVYILSENGDVLLHPNLTGENVINVKDPITGTYFVREMMKKERGWETYYWTKPGSRGFFKKLVYFIRVPELNWVIGLSIYQDELYEPILKAAYHLLLFTLLIFVLSSIVGSSYLRSYLVSIDRIMSSIRRIEAGDYEVESHKRRSDELGDIEKAISSMARGIKEREASLSRRIDQIGTLYEASLEFLKAIDEENLLKSAVITLRRVFDADLSFYISEKRELFDGEWGDITLEELKGLMRKGETGFRRFNSEYLMSAPVVTHEERGILGVMGKGEDWDESDERLLTTYASLLSLSLEKLHYAAHLEEMVKKRTEELKESERRFRVLFEKASEGIFIYDLKRDRIVKVNPALEELLGRSEEELLRLPPIELFPDDEKPRIMEYTERRIKGDPNVPSSYLAKMVRKDGTILHVRIALSPIDDEGRYVVVISDLTELVRLQNELNEQAIRDPLTGAFNRRKLDMDLEEFLKNVDENHPLGLLFFDLDHFKDVNDKYGHRVGDFLLKSIVRVVGNNLRIEDSLYRYGGEEFIVILYRTSKTEAREVAERLRRIIEQSEFLFRDPKGDIEPILIKITCSFGVAAAPEDARVRDDLINKADKALYRAKNLGRNRVVVYNEELEI